MNLMLFFGKTPDVLEIIPLKCICTVEGSISPSGCSFAGGYSGWWFVGHIFCLLIRQTTLCLFADKAITMDLGQRSFVILGFPLL